MQVHGTGVCYRLTATCYSRVTQAVGSSPTELIQEKSFGQRQRRPGDPCTSRFPYEIDGEQYVTVVAGWGGAFALTAAAAEGYNLKPRGRILTYKLKGEG